MLSHPGTYLRKNSVYSTASLRPAIIPSEILRQLEPRHEPVILQEMPVPQRLREEFLAGLLLTASMPRQSQPYAGSFPSTLA
jgi:hypothetical protein